MRESGLAVANKRLPEFVIAVHEGLSSIVYRAASGMSGSMLVQC
jgi:hypothetical protein